MRALVVGTHGSQTGMHKCRRTAHGVLGSRGGWAHRAELALPVRQSWTTELLLEHPAQHSG